MKDRRAVFVVVESTPAVVESAPAVVESVETTFF